MSQSVGRLCQLNGCEEIHYCKGWCRRHYGQHARGKTPSLNTSQYTEESRVCGASDCDVEFRQRSAGSPRMYCSRRCRDRTLKNMERARPDYIPLHRRTGRPPCSVDGCELPSYARQMCPMHYERLRKHGSAGESTARRAPKGLGSWLRTSDGYMRRSFNGEIQLQHRWVMEEQLGRPLWPDETVHHKNGDRSDNRIENLELWSSWQPAGQRVEDKLAWAREILERYGSTPIA